MNEGVSLKADGIDGLNKAIARLTDPRKRQDLLEQIGAAGVSQTQQRFYDQSGPDGTPWIQSLRAKEQSGETLRLSGRLSSSFSFAATDQSVEWGTNVIYAGIHHFGGVIKPKTKKALAFKGANGKFSLVKQVTMPARPFLGLTDQNRSSISHIIEDWAQGAWAQ